MKDFWTRSLPAVAILLVCFFGFTLMTMSGGANLCEGLRKIAVEATEAADRDCAEYGSGSNQCLQAQKDAGECWYAFFSAGCNY